MPTLSIGTADRSGTPSTPGTGPTGEMRSSRPKAVAHRRFLPPWRSYDFGSSQGKQLAAASVVAMFKAHNLVGWFCARGGTTKHALSNPPRNASGQRYITSMSATHTHLVRIRSLPGPKSGWRTSTTPIGGRLGLAEWCFLCTCALGVRVAVIALSLLKPKIFASTAYGGLANTRAWLSGNTSDYQTRNSTTPKQQGETKHREVKRTGSTRRLWQTWI